MLKRLYDWTMDKAAHAHAERWLFVISFIESSFFPIPPDVMLGPMILARPDRAYFYAGVCTVASVLGAILGYAIGYFLTDVGMMILTWLGKADTFEASKALFQQHGAWVILIKGIVLIAMPEGVTKLGVAAGDSATIIRAWAAFALLLGAVYLVIGFAGRALAGL